MHRRYLRLMAAVTVILVLISARTKAAPADSPEVPPEMPTPQVTMTFTGVIYHNPSAWTCHSSIVNTCVICTNTSAEATPVQVMSVVLGKYQWMTFTIPTGAEMRSCGNIIHLPVFPD